MHICEPQLPEKEKVKNGRKMELNMRENNSEMMDTENGAHKIEGVL